MLPEILTTEQASAALQCDADTTKALAANGTLPGIKFGRSWVFPRESFLQALNKAAVEKATALAKPAPGPDGVLVEIKQAGRRAPPKLPT